MYNTAAEASLRQWERQWRQRQRQWRQRRRRRRLTFVDKNVTIFDWCVDDDEATLVADIALIQLQQHYLITAVILSPRPFFANNEISDSYFNIIEHCNSATYIRSDAILSGKSFYHQSDHQLCYRSLGATSNGCIMMTVVVKTGWHSQLVNHYLVIGIYHWKCRTSNSSSTFNFRLYVILGVQYIEILHQILICTLL